MIRDKRKSKVPNITTNDLKAIGDKIQIKGQLIEKKQSQLTSLIALQQTKKSLQTNNNHDCLITLLKMS